MKRGGTSNRESILEPIVEAVTEVGVKPTVINVYGLGYIGLPTAATFATVGCNVLGVDICPDVVAKINRGDVHIQEPGLNHLVDAAIARGALRAAIQPEPADVHILAVPTPFTEEADGTIAPDLSYVEAATRTVATVLKRGDLIVLESTVPPKTCLNVIAPLLYGLTGLQHGRDYDLAHCPERVIPGRILQEIVANDRVIGGTTPQATQRAARLYARFASGELLLTDATTAEMCKLMENTFRDVNIALANELAAICAQLGIDSQAAIRLANHHPRVNIHAPGIGVGGHCIPIDPWFIVHAAPDHAPLLRAARAINNARPQQVVDEILQTMRQHPGKPVALLGLSYKPDVDDIRESPAMEIIEHLASVTSTPLYVVEPHLCRLPLALAAYPNLHFVTLEHALERSAIVVGLVGHEVFHQIPSEQLRSKILIDPLTLWHTPTPMQSLLTLSSSHTQPNATDDYALVLAA